MRGERKARGSDLERKRSESQTLPALLVLPIDKVIIGASVLCYVDILCFLERR